MLLVTTESQAYALNAELVLLITQLLKLANVNLDSVLIAMETVLLVAESMKFSKMENAAVKLAFILLKEYVDNADGTRFMIKVLVYAVFLVVVIKSLTLVLRDVYVFPT